MPSDPTITELKIAPFKVDIQELGNPGKRLIARVKFTFDLPDGSVHSTAVFIVRRKRIDFGLSAVCSENGERRRELDSAVDRVVSERLDDIAALIESAAEECGRSIMADSQQDDPR